MSDARLHCLLEGLTRNQDRQLSLLAFSTCNWKMKNGVSFVFNFTTYSYCCFIHLIPKCLLLVDSWSKNVLMIRCGSATHSYRSKENLWKKGWKQQWKKSSYYSTPVIWNESVTDQLKLRRDSPGEHIQRYSDLSRWVDQVQDLCRVRNVLLRLGNKYIHVYIHVQKPIGIFERLISQS